MLRDDRIQNLVGIKLRRSKYDRASMSEACEKANHQAEAMEEWWWTAYNIVGRQPHAVSNKTSVVN
jgi:hypothetical protein